MSLKRDLAGAIGEQRRWAEMRHSPVVRGAPNALFDDVVGADKDRLWDRDAH